MGTLVNSEESDEMPHYKASALFGKKQTKMIFREKNTIIFGYYEGRKKVTAA